MIFESRSMPSIIRPAIARLHLLSFLISLPVTSNVFAYECLTGTSTQTTVKFGATLVWIPRCIPFAIQSQSSALLEHDRLNLIQEGFEIWSREACTDLKFLVEGTAAAVPGFDHVAETNHNLLMSITDPSQLGIIVDPDLLAGTFLSYSVESGEIFDADIVFNEVRYKLSDNRPRHCPNDGSYDFTRALAHELGHVIGLDHSGAADSIMYRAPRRCNGTPISINADDRNAICQMYPVGQPAETCHSSPAGYDTEESRRYRRGCAEGCACGAVGRAPKAFDAVFWPLAVILGPLLKVLRFRRRLRQPCVTLSRATQATESVGPPGPVC